MAREAKQERVRLAFNRVIIEVESAWDAFTPCKTEKVREKSLSNAYSHSIGDDSCYVHYLLLNQRAICLTRSFITRNRSHFETGFSFHFRDFVPFVNSSIADCNNFKPNHAFSMQKLNVFGSNSVINGDWLMNPLKSNDAIEMHFWASVKIEYALWFGK